MRNFSIKTIFITFLPLFLVSSAIAGDKKLDSLFGITKHAIPDTELVKVYIKIAEEICKIKKDSSLFYYKKAYSHAKQSLEKLSGSDDVNVAKKLRLQIANALNKSGSVCDELGKYDKAIQFYNMAHEEYSLLRMTNEIAENLGNLGLVYSNKGDFPKAVEMYHKSLKIHEKNGYNFGIAQCYNNIGIVYYNQKNYDKAIEYYRLAQQKYQDQLSGEKVEGEAKIKEELALTNNNLGVVYYEQRKFKEALVHYSATLKIFEEMKDSYRVAAITNNIGLVYKDMGNFGKAIEYHLLALKSMEALGDKNGIAIISEGLANIYNQNGQYAKSIEYSNKTLEIAREIGALVSEKDAYHNLSISYEKIGDINTSYDFYKKYTLIKDSIFNSDKSQQVSELGAKYENEKKELLIKNQETELDKKKGEIEQQKYRMIGLSFLVLLFIALSFFIFRNYKQKQKANRILAHKNDEINKQKEEIVTQRDNLELLYHELEQKNEEITAQKDEIELQKTEIETQRDIVTEQKNEIEKIYSELKDSIYYAERIQQAVLSPANMHTATLGDYFILFKPRDIVSGDFYWATTVNNWKIFAVVDCTGHGVPGAFMSMLGIAFLSEIVRYEAVTKASQVLDELRKKVISALQQKGVTGEQKDGMDIAVCAVNTTNMELHFAGANNPAYILKMQNGVLLSEVTEIKGDKMPIGIHERMDEFTNHTIQLEKGDTVFLMSDGFEDQFGGPNNKKFKAKKMKQLLLDHKEKPMIEIRLALDYAFEEWRGMNEQIDDVCIMGVRF